MSSGCPALGNKGRLTKIDPLAFQWRIIPVFSGFFTRKRCETTKQFINENR
jgi:hypothetical protein